MRLTAPSSKELTRFAKKHSPDECMACGKPFKDFDKTLLGMHKDNKKLIIVGEICCKDILYKGKVFAFSIYITPITVAYSEKVKENPIEH